MNHPDYIHSMKKSSWDDAFACRINVTDKDKNTLGYLVPVGPWILSDLDAVEKIRFWRQRSMRMFLTQFESTVQRTLSYLKDLSISQNNRILFLLFDDGNRFVGHLGMSEVNHSNGELDNLMRGVEGGHPRLVYFSEVTLLNWAFERLGITESDVRVLSYNFLVISLHEEVGYKVVDRIPLSRNTKDEFIVHDFANSKTSNVKYTCVKMVLRKTDFYQINGWIN